MGMMRIGMMTLTVALTFHFFTQRARKPHITPMSIAPRKPVCTLPSPIGVFAR